MEAENGETYAALGITSRMPTILPLRAAEPAPPDEFHGFARLV
jgi:hypothetical protein